MSSWRGALQPRHGACRCHSKVRHMPAPAAGLCTASMLLPGAVSAVASAMPPNWQALVGRLLQVLYALTSQGYMHWTTTCPLVLHSDHTSSPSPPGALALQQPPCEVAAVLDGEASSSEDTCDDAYRAMHVPMELDEQRKFAVGYTGGGDGGLGGLLLLQCLCLLTCRLSLHPPAARWATLPGPVYSTGMQGYMHQAP